MMYYYCDRIVRGGGSRIILWRRTRRTFTSSSSSVDEWDRLGKHKYDTLTTMQETACTIFRDRPFIGTKNPNSGKYEWISYEEFGRKVTYLSVAMADILGIQKNDKIAVISKNRLEWALSAYACFRNGAHFVPMYEQQLPKDWTHIVSDSGASHLFVSTEDIFQRTKDLGLSENIVCFDLEDRSEDDPSSSFSSLIRAGEARVVAGGGARDSADGMSDSVSSSVATTILPPPPSPDDLAVLIYTSGTTGLPKGVMLSHENIASNVRSCREIFEHRLDASDTGLSVLPWAHVFGQTLDLHTMLSAGARLGIVESRDTLANDLQTVAPTLMCGVPLIFKIFYDRIQAALQDTTGVKRSIANWALRVAEERRHVFDEDRAGSAPLVGLKWYVARKLVLDKITSRLGGNLRCCFTGGAKLEFAVQEFFGDLGIPIIEGYGLTETSPVVVTEKFGPTEMTQGGLRAAPGVRVFICAQNAPEVLDIGLEGEIVVVGPNVMQGYHNLSDATAEVLFDLPGEGRAFRTGDMGKLDANGVLKITGRCKELYKLRNGKYVVPTQIEERVALSRFVSQCMLYGQDRDYNVALLNVDLDAIVAEVTGVDGGKNNSSAGHSKEEIASRQDVIAFVEKELARMSVGQKSYEWPRRFCIVAEDFSVENGLLTPKLSMKRNVIVDQFKDELEAMYTAEGRGEEGGR